MKLHRIVLTGPQGCGKTTHAAELAKKLKVPFIDADHVFKERYGTVADYVSKNNWSEFRVRENEIIKDICTKYAQKYSELIFSVGGGAVAHDQNEPCRISNVDILKNWGKLICIFPYPNLEKSARLLTDRVEADKVSAAQRPALNDTADAYERMLGVIMKRYPLYTASASAILYTEDKSFSFNNYRLATLVQTMENGSSDTYFIQNG